MSVVPPSSGAPGAGRTVADEPGRHRYVLARLLVTTAL
jgi:hypothetical protein